MLFIIAYNLVLAKVILYSLRSLVSVKKDYPSVGVLDSYQVLSSTVPAAVAFKLPSGRRDISIRSYQHVVFLQAY